MKKCLYVLYAVVFMIAANGCRLCNDCGYTPPYIPTNVYVYYNVSSVSVTILAEVDDNYLSKYYYLDNKLTLEPGESFEFYIDYRGLDVPFWPKDGILNMKMYFNDEVYLLFDESSERGPLKLINPYRLENYVKTESERPTSRNDTGKTSVDVYTYTITEADYEYALAHGIPIGE